MFYCIDVKSKTHQLSIQSSKAIEMKKEKTASTRKIIS
jgi:hypothetical protein